MADEADQAQGEVDAYNERMASVRKPEITVAAKGVCLNCGEKVGPLRRWCDGICRDEYEKGML